MKKILVTGGLGFIGGHVMEYAASVGMLPVAFDRYLPKQDYLLPSCKYDLFIGDVTDRGALDEAINKCDYAINLAGILGTSETVNNPFPSAEANIFGGLNFIEACRNYHKRGVQITVGNWFMNNTYAITKTAIERFALMYNKEHGTQIAVVRGLNAYGPRQKHKPVKKIAPNFICQALRHEPIKIFGTGESIMDMVHVQNLAQVLVEAAISPNTQYDKIYSAGTGVKTTVNEIAETVNYLTKNRAGIEHIPMRSGETDNSVVLGDPYTLDELQVQPMRSLFYGMRDTINWYRNNYPWQED